jgi:O-acetyl-ADP-ribose deacetylase (regulator of RNase III)
VVQIARGNLLIAPVEALVNTVNTKGVMGKGIALQFKQAFPALFHDYAKACHSGQVRLGKMHVYDLRGLTGEPRWIINFPTKGHWRERSRLIDIETGLEDLVTTVRSLGIRSIAIPPLGCGLGGLNWVDVRPRIEAAFTSLPDVKAFLFEPQTETQQSAPRP